MNECNPFHVWVKITCLMDFLKNGMQSVSWGINIIYFHILWPIFVVNYSRIFAKPHTLGMGVVTVNIANTNLLRSCHGESVWSFCISLCTVYFSICAFCIKLCMPGCPAVLAWLHVHKSMCNCFFTGMKQPRTFPTIFGNPCAITTFKAKSQ